MTGDIFIDIVAPVKKLPMWDSDVEAESVKMLPGGSALNQGRHLHALGTRVRFFGAVGNDTLGQSLVQQVAGQGFPTETIKMFSNLPSSVCMVLSGPSDRAFVSCYSTTDAFTTRDLQEQADHLDGCTHFHLGGYFNMKGLQSRDFTEFVLSLKSRLSMTISMNTQCDAAGHWCGEGNHLEEFLPSVDLLFVNISEGEHLCSALCHEGDRSIHALCKRFPNTTVVVTQGEHGCTVYRHGMHAIYVPTKPAVRIVDATGCGDAFIAGFLSSWLAQSAAPNTDAEHKAGLDRSMWQRYASFESDTSLRPLCIRDGGISHRGGAGPTAASRYGSRESKEALAELKTKLDFALSRLNDQDTQRAGIEEIREFLQTLYPDWFPMVITSIGEAGTNLKPLGRCESVKLLGLLAELHGDGVIPLLQRMLQVVLTRLQDADLHLREACAETVFRLTRALVVDADGSPVFATLLKPLFASLTEHNKWVQIGAASCICAVIQGSPPAVLNENLGRLCARLVQHLSLPLAMARPQLLSACIHVMQAVNLTDFDEVLPSLMPCLEICLNSTSDWQTRKQAVEVLQAIGDHAELGSSLQISTPSSPSMRPTPLQKRLSAMMEGLREDKVRAVREAVKDVLLRWSVTVKAAPSPTSTLAGERSDRPLRSSSPCAAQAPNAEREATWHRNSGVSLRSTSPLPDRDQVRLSEGTLGAQGPRQSRNVRAATRERDMRDPFADAKLEEDRGGDKQERLQEAAAEKVARNIAVKNALSNADLSTTKKPRPKRERVSIFSQPANSSFFQSANQHPAASDDFEDVVVGMPGMAGLEDRLLSSGSETRGLARTEGDLMEDLPAVQESPVHAKARLVLCANAGNATLLWQDESDPGAAERDVSVEPAKAHFVDTGGHWRCHKSKKVKCSEAAVVGRLSFAEFQLGASTPGFDRKPVPANRLEDTEDSKPRRAARSSSKTAEAPERVDAAGAGDNPSQSPTSSAPAQQEVSDAQASPHLAEDIRSHQASTEAPETDGPAPWWEDPSGRSEQLASAAPPHRPAASDQEETTTLLSHIEALSQRLALVEDEKRRSDRQMTERLQQLVRTCEGQGELIATQQQRLEAQEQQMQLMEERIAQQEDELAQMDQQLQEQQLQIQQQDQRLEQNDQMLNEHQQQLEQQEQELEKQILLTDAFISTASSSSTVKPAKQAWTAEDAGTGSGNPAKRWAADWKEGAEATRIPGPTADGAAAVGAGGALAGSSSERPLALGRAKVDTGSATKASSQKAGGQLWDSVMELCSERRFLEAYKQVIAEPEETCLLRLMKHTGPIVDRLDAESNSRLIRRLIHILSSPAKDPAATSIEQIFSWLWQALNQGIHFTASQVEDLVSALQKVSSAQSPLSGPEKAEAAQLLQQVSTHRRA
ncbi:TOR1L2 [Symbiodinium sp. KB8]|nr:TOR1L2 [Symbiodinium sp. KB8]